MITSKQALLSLILTSFSECECDARGTIQSSGDPAVFLCDQQTGLCQCQGNVGGDSCNICDVSKKQGLYVVYIQCYAKCLLTQDEYYSLDDGCLPCLCNIAASTSPVCDKDSPDGQCPCLPNVDTPTCTVPIPGYYFRYLDNELFEAEDAQLSEVCQVTFIHLLYIFILIKLLITGSYSCVSRVR